MLVRVLGYLVGFIFLLLSLIWLLSPQVIPLIINKQLVPFDLSLREQANIRVNPFMLSVAMEDVVLQSNKQQKAVFSLKKAEIQLALSKLFKQQLSFQLLDFDGLKLPVKQTDEGWFVMGQRINTTDQQKNPSPQSTPFKWRIDADSAELTNSQISIEGQAQHQLMIDSVQVRNFVYGDDNQTLEVAFTGSINQALATLESKLNIKEQQYSGQIQIDNFAISSIKEWIPAPYQESLADVSMKTTWQANTAESITAKLNDFSLNIKQLSVKHQPVDVALALFEVSIPEVSYIDEQLESQLALTFENFRLTKVNSEDEITRFNTLNLPMVNLSANQQTVQASLAQVNLDQFIASTLSGEDRPLLNLNKIVLSDIDLNHAIENKQTQLTVEKIALTDLSLYLKMVEQSIQNIVQLESNRSPAQGDMDEQKEAETSGNTFTFNVEEVVSNGELLFEDSSTTPLFSEQVIYENFQVTNIDNSDPISVSAYQLNGLIGKHGNFNLQGDYQVFNPLMNLSLNGQINEMSLPKLIGYFAKGAQINILSGQLDSGIDVQVTDNQIVGETALHVRGLELGEEKGESGAVKQDDSLISINTALGMLQDSKGNLALDVPLSGDVSSPEFGMQSFISIITQKAILMATESYVMQTMVPYGNIISIAKMAGEMMLKVRIDDLLYLPKQVDISEAQHVFTDNLIKLLTDKPELQIKICPIATLADLPEGPSLQGAEKTNYLHDLSERRGHNFKDYLIEKGKISSSRLLLCQAQVEENTQKLPRIVFGA